MTRNVQKITLWSIRLLSRLFALYMYSPQPLTLTLTALSKTILGHHNNYYFCNNITLSLLSYYYHIKIIAHVLKFYFTECYTFVNDYYVILVHQLVVQWLMYWLMVMMTPEQMQKVL